MGEVEPEFRVGDVALAKLGGTLAGECFSLAWSAAGPEVC